MSLANKKVTFEELNCCSKAEILSWAKEKNLNTSILSNNAYKGSLLQFMDP